MAKIQPSKTALVIETLTKQSYISLLSLWVAMALIFGTLYFLLALFLPGHGPAPIHPNASFFSKMLDCFYYSVITATSTGYGDITPHGFSKVLASLQSFMALVVFAIFVTKLVSHKQELALREVHKLTFEDVFHNTREGLYIVRKDCDRLIRHVEHHHELTDNHWEDLIVIYRQTQSLLQEIPQFYAEDENQEGFYTIDEDRESLLHEAVHRTLHRINQMIDIFSQNDVEWIAHEKSMQQLQELVHLVDVITPLWQKESPYTEVFEDILHVNRGIHKQIQDAVE